MKRYLLILLSFVLVSCSVDNTISISNIESEIENISHSISNSSDNTTSDIYDSSEQIQSSVESSVVSSSENSIVTSSSDEIDSSSSSESTVITKYTVSFVTNCEADVPPIEVDENSIIAAPHTINRDGYNFICWCKDSSLLEQWDFATDMVTSNVTLYGKWSINSFSITFYPENGEESFVREINYNDLVEKPTINPSKDNYTFKGWTLNGVLFDFANNRITSSIDLHAKYEQDHILSFNCSDEFYINGNLLLNCLDFGETCVEEITYSIIEGSGTITGNVLSSSSVGNITVRATLSSDHNYYADKIIYASELVHNSISINEDAMELKVGETADLSYSYSPLEATPPTVEWISSDNTKLSVDDFGHIEALQAGSFVVTVRSNLNYEDMINITVIDYEYGPELVLHGDFEAYEADTVLTNYALDGGFGSIDTNTAYIRSSSGNKYVEIGTTSGAPAFKSFFWLTPPSFVNGKKYVITFDYEYVNLSGIDHAYGFTFLDSNTTAYCPIHDVGVINNRTLSQAFPNSDVFSYSYTALNDGWIKVTLEFTYKTEYSTYFNSIRFETWQCGAGDYFRIDNISCKNVTYY